MSVNISGFGRLERRDPEFRHRRRFGAGSSWANRPPWRTFSASWIGPTR